MAKIYVGMSGWTYEGWRGNFYPKGLVQKRELEYASRQVTSIEINGTFYGLQKPAVFQKWYDETPEGFCFAVKAPQYITHIQRLKEIRNPMANFFASGLFCLKEKLGPILWQFPPNVMLKDDRFEKFLKLLPYDSKAASRLAKKHTDKLKDRSFTDVHGQFPIRHAFEFRHSSFKNPDFVAMLREYGVAFVFAHSTLKAPYTEDLTADFVYARMHGQEAKHKKGYSQEVLKWWVKRVKSWTTGKQPKDADCVLTEKAKMLRRDAFIYFGTEAKEYAPSDALRFLKELG